jgi:hypothetical protein
VNRTATAILCCILALGTAGGAEPPGLISYQGVLRDASDRPLTGTYDMIFRFVDAASGGTLLLTDYHTGPNGVVVSGGLFTAYLGGGMLSPGTEASIQGVFANRSGVYVEVQVGSETLSPRVQVVSAGYALNAGRVGGQVAGDFLDKGVTAQVKAGPLTANGGLVGNGSGVVTGVEGTSAGGNGVKGSSSAASGTTYGVYGVSASTSGTGVVGEVTAASGSAWGVQGKSVSSSGIGVIGSALAASGSTEGVRGQSTSPDGKGVVGGAFATSGASYGVFGESQSPDGTGVYGRASAGSGYTTGVGGETYSAYGTGVAGVAHASAGDAWGVYGATTSPDGWGVYADGGLAVIGDLVATGGKSFVTEHPTAPDQEIRYACIEGGEVGVYQRGVARLSAGETRVTLPSHFSLVAAGQFTVQVTPLEACGGLYVPGDTVGPAGFTVREQGGGTSDAKFSYLVMADRTGYEGFEPVRSISLGEKILISKHLTVDQRAVLRGALGRAGENGIEAGARAELYASLQRGDYDETCRLLGGCPARRDAVPSLGPKEPEARPASENRAPAPREGSSAERRLVAPDAGSEAQEPSFSTGERGAASGRTPERVLLAEPHPASEQVETGDVVVLDHGRAGAVRPGTTALDPNVVGIVAEVPNPVPAGSDAPIVLIGTALCKADAAYGSIAVGDLLVASPTPGHAMRATAPASGTILGKALEPLEAGAGVIKVLVMPR